MKITKKHFELFEKACNDYLKLFKINDYKIWIEKKSIRNADTQAAISLSGNVTFTINTDIDFGNRNIEDEIDELAKHEVIHCLIGRLSGLARVRWCSESEFNDEEEHLVRKLTKLL